MASVTQYLANALGKWDQKWQGTNGAAHVTLPQNSSGTLTVGELDATAANPTTSTVNFANGLNGVVIDYMATDAAATDVLLYVAFGQTAFNDVTTEGQRFVIPVGDSRTFSFEGSTPLPNSMTLSIVGTGTDSKVFYSAAQN